MRVALFLWRLVKVVSFWRIRLISTKMLWHQNPSPFCDAPKKHYLSLCSLQAETTSDWWWLQAMICARMDWLRAAGNSVTSERSPHISCVRCHCSILIPSRPDPNIVYFNERPESVKNTRKLRLSTLSILTWRILALFSQSYDVGIPRQIFKQNGFSSAFLKTDLD